MPVISRAADTRSHQMHGATFTPMASPTRGARENSVWKVSLPPGAPATPHQVTREEILVVTGGRVEVHLAGEVSPAGAGDVIVVPADTDFALEVVGDESFEAIVCLPVGGQARLGDGTTLTLPWAQ